MRRVIVAGTLALGVAAITAAPAEAVTFTATLNAIRISAQPGQVVTRPFELTLGADQPRTVFTARAEDWWRSEDNTQSFYAPPGRLRRSCASWVSVNPMEAAVAPGGTLKVRVTVAVPSELENGGYWCALTVDEAPDPAAADAGVAVRFLASVSVGIFVYIDPVERAGEIGSVEIARDEAHITLHNRGNTPLTVEGRVEFLRAGVDDGAAPVATAVVPRATVLTEPARMSVLRTVLPTADDLPSGRYLVRAILDIGLDHFIGLEREVDIRRLQGDDGSR
jgi:hypothetical protein